MAWLRGSLPELKETLLEALKAVLPVVGIVAVLCFSVAPISPSILLCFLLGAAMIVLGMMFFTLGAEASMTPMGERVGAAVARSRSLGTARSELLDHFGLEKTEKAEKFLGFSLVNEKEMVFIVVKTATKDRIMRAIMDKAGLGTKAQSIVFSLPVTGTAGMRLLELAGDETDD